MIDQKLLFELYSYFYKNYFDLKDSYKFNPTEKNKKLAEQFISSVITESRGFRFIWTYFIFQFNYYSELELVNNYGKLQLSYILGKSSIKRWELRDIEFDYTLEFSEKVNFSYFFEKRISEAVNSRESVDILKKRLHHNSDFGLNYCLENTSLYTARHIPCLTCKHKLACKRILEENYAK